VLGRLAHLPIYDLGRYALPQASIFIIKARDLDLHCLGEIAPPHVCCYHQAIKGH